MAAEQVGRICYAMEIDPLYVDTAVKRWEKKTGQMAIRSEAGQYLEGAEVANV